MTFSQAWCLLWLSVATTSALLGYDCGHPETTYSMINLGEVAKCPDAQTDYEAPKEGYVRIIQASRTAVITGHRCRLVVTKEITRCGWDRSFVYGSHWPLFLSLVHLFRSQCDRAMRSGYFYYNDRRINFTSGIPHREVWFPHGGLDSEGVCTRATDIWSEGKLYHYSYQRITIEVMMEEVKGEVDTITETVTFPRLGLTANFSDHSMNDYEAGTVTWPRQEPKCRDGISQIYKGPAWTYLRKDNGAHTYLTDAIILLNNTETDQYAGLVIKGKQPICGGIWTCYATHIKGLMVCPYNIDEKYKDQDYDFKESADTTSIELQSQTGYIHLSTSLQKLKAFAKIQADICAIDRKTLNNKIQAIAGESTPYALMDLYGPGHTGFIAGSVAYLTKCVPVEVNVTSHENCTQEIPVIYNGENVFVDSINRIIQPFPTIISCSVMMPIRWKLNGEWYCARPAIGLCDAPQTLAPLAPSKMDFDFTTGMGKTVYSPEQLAAHRRYGIQVSTRGSVIQTLANNAIESAHEGRLGTYLGPMDFNDIETVLTPRMIPGMAIFGVLWNYMVAFGMILVFAQFIFGWILRSYGLWRRRGCGWFLLGAATDTTFLMATIPVSILKSIFQYAKPRGPDNMEHTQDTITTLQAMAYRNIDADMATATAPGDDRLSGPYVTAKEQLTRERFRVLEEEIRLLRQHRLDYPFYKVERGELGRQLEEVRLRGGLLHHHPLDTNELGRRLDQLKEESETIVPPTEEKKG